ncbi:alpha/beta hydrolase [Nocardia pseudobrasiliensis]|uniref:Diacylglycerol O-acyltransferase/trehalose O-mycolyltransferase n=1 Tax=Nocardia pseudobrasiliensis TaxID=45979 RepID=A0A370HUS4_9NOCA|nr:alpha/beta hydrolase family protein [Nocardia pseudobrasiliensis]RDI61701.1 diacylglycerol O-acyltransferase/trehalose O-mycolyltransferase [Nocardia pseudobrasiliensis]
MRFGRSAAPEKLGWRSRLLALSAAALAFPLAAGVAAPTVALAAPVSAPVHRTPAGGFEELMVPSSMGPVKVQVQWAAHGGNAALLLLDGLRARDDYNAWTKDVNAPAQWANDDVTLVMPVGGQSSWYADWMQPSNLNGQKFTYKWETFLTKELPDFLTNYGVARNNYAVAGLSMSGPAALRLAAFHRDQFKYAASFSGPLNWNAPGMREAIRVMMLDAGHYNVDAMAAPWSPQWLRSDPMVFAPQLRGLPMFISSATGVPGQYDHPNSAVGVFNTANAMGIEAISFISSKSFQSRLASLNIPANYDFPVQGTHSWNYWIDELGKARPGILAALNAG